MFTPGNGMQPRCGKENGTLACLRLGGESMAPSVCGWPPLLRLSRVVVIALGDSCVGGRWLGVGAGNLCGLDLLDAVDEVEQGRVDDGLVFLVAVDGQFVVKAMVGGDPD